MTPTIDSRGARRVCPRCGLEIYGTHTSIEECLRTLRDRHGVLARKLHYQGAEMRTLRDELARARRRGFQEIAERVAALERVAAEQAQRYENRLAFLLAEVSRLSEGYPCLI